MEKQQIEDALNIAAQFGGIEGSHHKQWIIDQMVRKLTGDRYEEWVKTWKSEPGYEDSEWDEGIAP